MRRNGIEVFLKKDAEFASSSPANTVRSYQDIPAMAKWSGTRADKEVVRA